MTLRIACICLVLLLIVQPLPVTIAQSADPVQMHPTPPVIVNNNSNNASNSPEQASVVAHWLSLFGSGFVPETNSIAWYYPGSGGCIHPTVVGAWRGAINLPDWSTITAINFGYYNYSNSTHTSLKLMQYGTDGTETQIGIITAPDATTTTQQFRVASIALTTPFMVENDHNSYGFVWAGVVLPNVQELCSAQVGYSMPVVYGTFFPEIGH